ncbi:hypothetical protein THASP1DRAFT_31214 [Thamnocephalis sphaerospora]|uniref:Uncharacterized protein n=1 Tax=Thamnocephalis sphaerospora TaxID=78915 RepID=A0A4P9XMA0_9FUNG|nr:hypothetical protein THASP1DRAFT_31214 [Thamnocephalis sphaerospora]|eukprot:RKP06976.1 hypothetical protein THASP1DRAFT_31214 [Thamnocephalis sphaerospora]
MSAVGMLQTTKRAYAAPVIAAYFLSDDALLVGTGPYVKLYRASTGELLAANDVLGHLRIHHLVADRPAPVGTPANLKRLIAVAGAKTVVPLTVSMELAGSEYRCTLESHKAWQFCDWILDVQWLYAAQDTTCCESPTQVAVAFAHNFVELWSYPEHRLLRRIGCEEKCLLYAARFFGHHEAGLQFAAGTVFNEVILWRPTEKEAVMDCEDRCVQLRLRGHEGVVFSVRFSRDGKRIASVSDDRTARVWSLVDERARPAILYGHQSRVWDCQFAGDVLVSVSEDRTCRVWRDDANAEDMACLAVWAGHRVKNARCVAVNPSCTIVATGGDDSGVRLWPLDSLRAGLVDTDDQLIDVVLPDASNVMRKESIRNFVHVSADSVVVSTFSGCIVRHQLSTHNWQALYEDIALVSYCSMAASPDGLLVVCGSMGGTLTFLDANGAREPTLLQANVGKVFEIFVLQGQKAGEYDVFSSVVAGDLVWSRYIVESNTAHVIAVFELPKFTVVASVALCITSGILMCGSREGALLAYDVRMALQCIDSSKAPSHLTAAWELRRAHGRDTVTSVTVRHEASGLQAWTTGRDGAYVQWRVQIADDDAECRDITLERALRSRITKGWLERMYFADGEVILAGFFQKRFFLFNETQKYEAMACGGAHRRWRLRLEDDRAKQISFAFIRAERVHAYQFNPATSAQSTLPPKLQDNFHGREIRTVQLLAEAQGADPVLLTAGEDGVVCASTVNACNVRPHLQIKAHSSMVRASAICPSSTTGGKLLFTGGGADELRAWRIDASASSQTETPKGQPVAPAIHELAACPRVCDDLETRVMGIAAFPLTDVPGQSMPHATHAVCAVYSDAYLRVWAFSEYTKLFKLIGQSPFHDSSILCCAHRMHHALGRVLLFTGAADGRIAIWDVGEKAMWQPVAGQDAVWLLQPVLSFQAHQSGINVLDVHVLESTHDQNSAVLGTEEARFWVASGGDDNALSLFMLTVSADAEATHGTGHLHARVTRRLQQLHAHGSAIQGCRFLDATLLATTAWDMRLNLWALPDTADSSSAVTSEAAVQGPPLLHSTMVNVADPSDLDVLQRQVFRQRLGLDAPLALTGKRCSGAAAWTLAVCGAGLQLLEVQRTAAAHP